MTHSNSSQAFDSSMQDPGRDTFEVAGTAVYNSHIGMIRKWIRNFVNEREKKSIDMNQLANYVAWRLICHLRQKTGTDEITPEIAIRKCYRITRNHCINAVNHIRSQKFAESLSSSPEQIAYPSDKNGSNDPKEIVASRDFLAIVSMAVDPLHRKVLDMIVLGYSKTEIATEIGISKKVLKRMTDRIGKVINEINRSSGPRTTDRNDVFGYIVSEILRKRRFFREERGRILACTV